MADENKKQIKFNKYNSEENYKAKIDVDVDNATFSVVKDKEHGEIKDLYLYKTKLTDVYKSRKDDSAKTTVTVGGIPAETSLEDLKKLSLGEVIDMMLFKTTYPTIKRKPSVSITGYNQHVLIEKSDDKFTLPTVSNIKVDKGLYVLDINGEEKNLGDVSKGIIEPINITSVPASRTIQDGAYVNISVTLKGGDKPKDSDGKIDYESDEIPYKGETKTIKVDIYPYYNWYATGISFTSENQPLIDYTQIIDCKIQKATHHIGIKDVNVMIDMGNGYYEIKENNEIIDKRQQIKVPGYIKNCKTYVNGSWFDYDFEGIYGKPEIISDDISGKIYHLYTMKKEMFNDGPIGGVRLKFTVSQTE